MARDETIHLDATLPYRLNREGRWVVAVCDILDVASQGRTERSALRNLRDALVLFLETCIASGTLERVLEESGFERVEIQGIAYWLAGPRIKVPRGSASLSFRARISAPEPKASPRPRTVSIRNIPPYLIRAEWHGEARAG